MVIIFARRILIFLVSQAAKDIGKAEDIILLDYRALQAV
jgi:hypothetical protein